MKQLSFRTLFVCMALAVGSYACSQTAEEPEPEYTQGDEYVEPAPEPEALEPVAVDDPTDVHIEGDHVTIDDHILFATNSDEILPASSTILDHLGTFLRNHSGDILSLQIIGHTDRQGGREHNQQLSQRRAASVARALQERGVTQPLESIGRGMDQRLCTEDTAECHERNRRVEFIIVME